MMKHYRSKHKFPTVFQRNMEVRAGHITARHDLEKELGRQLHPDTKVKTKGGNWCFIEPDNA